jgi:hypothetical protein
MLLYAEGTFALDLAQCTLWSCSDRGGMKLPVKKRVGKKRQLSRTELARRIITDYADQLREIIRKLRRRHLH